MKCFYTIVLLYLLLPLTAQAEVLERSVSSYNGYLVVTDNAGIRSLIAQTGMSIFMYGSMQINNPTYIVEDSQQIMSILTHLHTNPENIFNIGLGSGSLIRNHLQNNVGSNITTTEIDVELIKLAKNHFNIDIPNHQILVGDGSKLLGDQTMQYDVIWVNTYSAIKSGLEMYSSTQFRDVVNSHLKLDGILVMNLETATQSELNSLKSQYRRVFSDGLYITTPVGNGTIVVFGNHTSLSCDNFWNIYENWFKSKRISVVWYNKPNLRTSGICTDI